MQSLISELKRRNVVKVGVAYAIVAWLLIQMAGALEPALLLPDWVDRVVTVFVLIGFPIVLIFAWAFELTPDGLKLTSHVEPGESITRRTGKKLEHTIIALLGLVVVFFVGREFLFSSGDDTGPVPEGGTGQASIAVLPFEDFSEARDQEFFSKGISEEILNLLAKTNALRVAARTSSFAFAGSELDIREIGDKLDVQTVLEGSIRKAGPTIRITAQLIDVDNGYHLWSETYNRNYTDIFAIQDEIAAEILSALKVHLLGEDDAPVTAAAATTADLDAYNAYLIGRERLALSTREDVEAALGQFEQAISLDPEFAPAHAGIAHGLLLLERYQFGGNETVEPETDARIRQHLDKAMAVAPDLAEVQGINGYYQLRRNRFEEAERSFNKAIELNPNYALAYTWRAQTAYEQARYLDMLADKEKAYALDPMSLEISANLVYEYRSFWRPKDAERVAERMFALHPDHPLAYDAAIDNLQSHGRSGEALLMTEKALRAHPEDRNLLGWRAFLLWQVGLLDEAEVSGNEEVRFLSLLMRGRYDEARKVLDEQVSQNDRPNTWYSHKLDYLRIAGSGPADPEFSETLGKELAALEKNNVQWRSRCMPFLINNLRDAGREDDVAGMMAACSNELEERLKVRYLCPCTFFSVVMYTILDGRLDEAVQRADQWLTNGDAHAWLPFEDVFSELKGRPEYESFLARNEEQLARQRQIYLSGRDTSSGPDP